MEETHFLVWQEGEDKDGGENGEGEEGRKGRQAENGRNEKRPQDWNQGMGEVPPPTLHPVKAAKILHHVGFEEVEGGEGGRAIEKGISHHSEEHSSQGGKKQGQHLPEWHGGQDGDAEEGGKGKPSKSCSWTHHHTERGQTKGARVRIRGEGEEEEGSLQGGGKGA